MANSRLAKKKDIKLERAFIRVYREEALIEQKGQCKYCYEPLTYKITTAEHVLAKSKGGLNRKDNIGASCQDCNKVKSNMKESSFLKLIKSFPSGHNFDIIMVWSRRRINLAFNRLEKKLFAN